MTTTENLSNTTYLIMGGARSGKSSYAENIAQLCNKQRNQEVTYIATANVFDNEMENRVEQHKNDRPKHWQTIEEPIALAEALEKHAAPNKVILVDCLTMWVTNLLIREDAALFETEINKFHQALPTLSGTILFVSNEVGMGIVPMGELSRNFVDESGRLHQRLAQSADHVLLMVAGLALAVKGSKPF